MRCKLGRFRAMGRAANRLGGTVHVAAAVPFISVMVLSVLVTTSLITTQLHAAPGDRPEGRALVKAQTLQQTMFRHMVPATRALNRAHAGTAAWWLARRDAHGHWLRYMDGLSRLSLPPGQIRAMTWAPRGALWRFDEAMRAADTLAWTGAFVRRSPAAVERLPDDPKTLPQTGGRVRFAGRSSDGAEVLVIDTETCAGDERTTAVIMPPSPGFGGKRIAVQRTGMALAGGAIGGPGKAWRKLQERNERKAFGKQSFIRQSNGLVDIQARKAVYRGPGTRRSVSLPISPTVKNLPWRQRECCGWRVDSVLVDSGSGRVFAAVTERCRWNAIEADACYDPALKNEAYANQHCQLRKLHWIRFGKVMRTDQLFERPKATRPLNPNWRLPRARQ